MLFSGLTMANDIEKRYEFSDIHSINISAMTGKIEIHPGAGDKIVLHHTNGMEKSEKLTVEIDTALGELYIKEAYGENDPKGRTSWDITIPQNLKMKSIDCFSGLDLIEIHDIDVDFIKCHAATGEIGVSTVKSKEMNLTTTSGSLTVENCEIEEYAKMVSSGGDVTVDLPYIPAKKMHTASTTADSYLTIGDFGENFKISIMKNENEGQIHSPFKCTESYTERYHKDDTFRTDYCIIKRGRGGPEIDMLTGYGQIFINNGGGSGK